MRKDIAIEAKMPEEPFQDALTAVLRDGARKMLAVALEKEVNLFLKDYEQFVDAQGHREVVRNGYLPEREIQTGVGAINVKVPRVKDKRKSGEKVRFNSQILPPYLRRTKSLDELIPWLYLKGVSTGDFSEALSALLGANAPGLSASTVSRLKESWQADLDAWQKRSLSGKEYVYFWADGVHFGARMEDEKQCILVILGATADGRKELVGMSDGYRESEQSWYELLVDLKKRGLKAAPKLAVGDGALGFWKALPKVFGKTRRQRCTVHKTVNVLDKLPKSAQKKAKSHLQEIWMAETKENAEKAFDYFIEAYGPKYPKAAACLEKDREDLLAFYNFPAEHWVHIRTTNPIESTFATVRLRTNKTRGCLTRDTMLTMVFKLTCSAQKRWRRLNVPELLADVITGVNFVNGVKEKKDAA
jgi:transposase-like protein